MFFESKFLGRIPYTEGVDLMNQLRDQRLKNKIPDTLLFLEHEPVITMGRRQSQEDLKLTQKELLQKGIEFVIADRGGKLTYHGPGQLVVYFVFNIKKRGWGIDEFVNKTLKGVSHLLEAYRIKATYDSKNPGLWVEKKKIASVGFHVQQGVTTHGIALNINCDLTPFSFIIPCGIEGSHATSMLEETRKVFEVEKVSQDLQKEFQKFF